MKLRNRIVRNLIVFANGAINYILVTIFGLLLYLVIPCAIFLPLYALFLGKYVFALIAGALSLISFLCVRAIGLKRAKKAQEKEAKQLARQRENREQQLEEIASLMHDLRQDYAHGRISDEELDRQLDFIECLESEAGISMDESMELNYESIYQASQPNTQMRSQKDFIGEG